MAYVTTFYLIFQTYDGQKVNKISMLTSSDFIFIYVATSSQLL